MIIKLIDGDTIKLLSGVDTYEVGGGLLMVNRTVPIPDGKGGSQMAVVEEEYNLVAYDRIYLMSPRDGATIDRIK